MAKEIIAKTPALTEPLVLIDGKLNQAFNCIYDDETQSVEYYEVVEKPIAYFKPSAVTNQPADTTAQPADATGAAV